MYQIGEFIVKATNGVCEVKDLVHLDFSDTDSKKLYYLLVPVTDQAGKIYMPATSSAAVRKVMTKQEAMAFIQKIPSVNEPWIDNEKTRERSYKEAITSNDPERLVGIIKLICDRKEERVRQGRKVTAVDERYFKLAENLLYAELEVALDKDKEEVHRLIQEQCR